MSEQAMQPTPLADAPLKPDPAMEKVMEAAFRVTDLEFKNHVVENWNQLGDKKVQAYIAQDNDIPAQKFSRWHLLNTLEETREVLVKRMARVRNGQDFSDECASFINDQIEHLFFVSNDMASAQIARDYFERFLETATAGLQGMGRIDADEAASYAALGEYYDVGFDAYDDLRDLVRLESDGATSSLVTYALARQTEEKHRPQVGQLVQQSHTNALASDMLHTLSNNMYQKMMASQPIFEDQDLYYRPMSTWIYRQACRVAEDEYTQNVPETFEREQANGRKRKNMETQHALINAAIECIEEGGEIEGILDAQHMFDAQRKQRLQMPENYDELLEESLEAAAEHAKASVNAAIITETGRRGSGRKPTSRRLGQVLWSSMDHPEVVAGSAEEVNAYWTRELQRSPSPQHAASMADLLLDELAEDVCYSSNSPALFLHGANFLASFRRELGSRMHDAGAFRPEDFASLKRVEEKCLHYYESYQTLREWVLTHSEGAYDRLGTQEYMKHAAKTGRLWQDLELAEWNEAIVPAAQESFVKLLRDMNVRHKGCDHLLMPLIAAKARTIAVQELGEPDPKADDFALVAQYEKIWERAGEILHTALDKLPQRDVDKGRKVKEQPFTADHVAKLMKDLDQQLKLTVHRGTAH